jgi:cell division protein FtsI (penicillin-binding protein 3)
MQTILEHVVSQGLGKKAGSKSFKVAGKTGTAQVADQYGGYHSGVTRYWLSFAGYFPADNPRYTCIVCLKKSGLPASGGGMSGVVFHRIAEGVMAQNLKLSVEDARDSSSVLKPDVKDGNVVAADYVLNHLGVKANGNWRGEQTNVSRNIMPNVTGMGARDAVYTLESRGVKAIVKGCGRVKSQSICSGTAIKRGMVCELKMSL